MAVGRNRVTRLKATVIIAVGVFTAAAKEQVAAVRPQFTLCQAEEVRAAAQDIILAQSTEDNIVSAIAFNVVLPVCCWGIKGRHQVQVPDQVAGTAMSGIVITPVCCLRASIRCARSAGVDGDLDIIDQSRKGSFDTAITLEDILTHLAEDQVMRLTSSNMIIAEAACAFGPVVDCEGVEFFFIIRIRIEDYQVLSPPWIVIQAGAVRIAVIPPVFSASD